LSVGIEMMQPDVAIIGAGAAGVAAGIECRARGLSFVILEASGRVGGRAYTDKTSLPHPWDQGCYWFHSADVNPLVAWADRLGTTYERRDRMDDLIAWAGGGWFDAGRAAALGAKVDDVLARACDGAAGALDLPLSEALPDGGEAATMIRSIVCLMTSADPEEMSALGFAEYADSHVNLEVTSGYGDLIERMAAGLPVRLNRPVTEILQQADGVRVVTDAGTIEARAAIVTASTNVLCSGTIRFHAPLVAGLLDMISDVPCGAYEKIAIALRRLPDGIGDNLFLWVDPANGNTPLGFQFPPNRVPLAIAHVGGSDARALAKAGKAAMVDLATERLVSAFGTDIRGEIVGSAVTGWQANPFVQGAYSYTKPGLAKRRHEIIAAETGDIVFAGEAFSLPWHTTAHGAYQSGRDVAARLAARLAKRNRAEGS
jgi:monoamine oxidase